MKTRVSIADLATPFFVKWGACFGGDEKNCQCEYFSKLSDAFDFVDTRKDRISVWLGEVGTYETESGNQIQDWIYFWWNGLADWGKPPTHDMPYTKTGYPHRALRNVVNYIPFRLK